MSTIYVEADDEITTAIGRIRATTDTDAILVVPAGSKIATSRINFKLLARDAAERRMNVVAVSDEPQVRALAISAGLPAYDSISAAEQALAIFREQDRRLNERIHRTMPREHPSSGEPPTNTQVLPPSVVARAAAVPLDTAVLPVAVATDGRKPRKKRRIPIAPLLVIGLVVVLLAGVAYGAYVFLPTASITLRPLATQVQTQPFVVTADPNVAVVDPGAGVIPAQTVSVPVHVEGTFNATGIDAHDTRATGTVTFKSENTVNAVSIPKDTTVSTQDGTDFVTLEDVVVPKASFSTGPTTADVDVRAVKGGTAGNVDAGTITVVPAVFSQQVISVSNSDPTTGGKHVEDQVVSQDDYNAALTSLSGQLETALQTALANPNSVPRGLVAFPQTAQLSAGQPDQPATAIVGVVEPNFAIALDATADVTAVNESQIEQVAAARLSDALQSGQQLVGSAVNATHDAGTVVGNAVVYNVQASGQGFRNPDPQSVMAAIRGKSLVDARAALAALGTADISIWPDFVDHLPDQTARISIIIVPPAPAPSPTPAIGPSLNPSSAASTSAAPAALPTIAPLPSAAPAAT